MIAARFSAARANISGSPRPPVTLLMITAPASSAARATDAFEVSIERCTRTAWGKTARPPAYALQLVVRRNRLRASAASIRRRCSRYRRRFAPFRCRDETAASAAKNSPPSENESGVTLSTPIIIARFDRSMTFPATFQAAEVITLETITAAVKIETKAAKKNARLSSCSAYFFSSLFDASGSVLDNEKSRPTLKGKNPRSSCARRNIGRSTRKSWSARWG